MSERKDQRTQVVESSEASEHWDSLLSEVRKHGKRILVEDNGVPIAGIVSAADVALLRRIDDEHARRFAALERIRAPFRGVPTEKIETEVRRAIEEVRAEDAGRAGHGPE